MTARILACAACGTAVSHLYVCQRPGGCPTLEVKANLGVCGDLACWDSERQQCADCSRESEPERPTFAADLFSTAQLLATIEHLVGPDHVAAAILVGGAKLEER